VQSGVIFSCRGGTIVVPARGLVLVDRADGGNLIVNPPREVWERSELTPDELVQWSFLVAATGRAMIDVLPVLEGGCVNYWEAGNWAVNDDAEPRGPKRAPEHRRVHMHLLGRSRTSQSPSWVWGEAPRFPAFRERHAWAAAFEPLTAGECSRVTARAAELLATKYGIDPSE
jgi:diadenosine tetraphosphate (Ap4A) HIT family hydrolase